MKNKINQKGSKCECMHFNSDIKSFRSHLKYEYSINGKIN